MGVCFLFYLAIAVKVTMCVGGGRARGREVGVLQKRLEAKHIQQQLLEKQRVLFV